MIYIYDTPIISADRDTVFERYGAKYKLEAKHKMGDQVYFTFSYPGMETLLVVPRFILQYNELAALIRKLGTGKTFDAFRRLLRKIVEIEDEDEYPSDTSETKVLNVLVCGYKDIGVTIEYENRTLRLVPEFEIRQNNIFGNGQVVSLAKDEDLQ